MNERGYRGDVPYFGPARADAASRRARNKAVNRREAQNDWQVFACRGKPCKLKLAALKLNGGQEWVLNIRGPFVSSDEHYTFRYTAAPSSSSSGMNLLLEGLDAERTVNIRCAAGHWNGLRVSVLQAIASAAILIPEPESRGREGA